MNNFAPVLIPTLNRHIHFKRCVESLSVCTHADKTDLFIFLDYPLKDTHWEGYEIIKTYLPDIKGFKTVTIIEREENYGAIDNLFNAIAYVYESYDSLIISEDDNVFAPDFLSFVNNGLDVYKNREDIFSVSGYQYPITIPQRGDESVYIFQGFSAWGVGIWKDKWEGVTWDISSIKSFLDDKEQMKKFNGKAVISGLKRIVETGYLTGDTYICYHQHMNNLYSVFPFVSRVRNTGHDGSGINGGNIKRVRNIYLNQSISDGKLNCLLPPDIMPDPKINNYLTKHFNPSIIRKTMNNPLLAIRKAYDLFREKFH